MTKQPTDTEAKPQVANDTFLRKPITTTKTLATPASPSKSPTPHKRLHHNITPPSTPPRQLFRSPASARKPDAATTSSPPPKVHRTTESVEDALAAIFPRPFPNEAIVDPFFVADDPVTSKRLDFSGLMQDDTQKSDIGSTLDEVLKKRYRDDGEGSEEEEDAAVKIPMLV
jgi:hypothetical protein